MSLFDEFSWTTTQHMVSAVSSSIRETVAAEVSPPHIFMNVEMLLTTIRSIGDSHHPKTIVVHHNLSQIVLTYFQFLLTLQWWLEII